MKYLKPIIAAAGLALLGSVVTTGSASAGTWYLNASACPDFREDRRDRRYNYGRWDRREDRRDRRVIECPPRAWTYVADRYEQRYGFERGTGARRGTPGIVYRDGPGQFFRVNRRGERRYIDVVIERPRWRQGRHADRRWHRDRRDRRSWRHYH